MTDERIIEQIIAEHDNSKTFFFSTDELKRAIELARQEKLSTDLSAVKFYNNLPSTGDGLYTPDIMESFAAQAVAKDRERLTNPLIKIIAENLTLGLTREKVFDAVQEWLNE